MTLENKGRPGLSSTPLAGQVLGMIEAGRQTAPPRDEVVLVTSLVFNFSLEASLRGSEFLCSTPPLRMIRPRVEVCQHLTTDLVTAASASSNQSRSGEPRIASC